MTTRLTLLERRNFVSAMWHGAFLTLGVALTQPTTVIAAFVADLTGSTVWVGGLLTLLTVAGTLPQIFVARWIEPRPRKMPCLMAAIYLRVVSWASLAVLTFAIGASHPHLLAWVLVGLLTIFYAAGGLGGVPYTDIIGKIIPRERRGAFFGGRKALAGPLAVGAALSAQRILANVGYPTNYALLFGLAALSLLVASLGFWFIREPLRGDANGKVPSWRGYGMQLLGTARRLGTLIGVQLFTGFSLMVLPFYIVYARQELDAPAGAIGWFMLAQVLGGVLGNLIWARLIEDELLHFGMSSMRGSKTSRHASLNDRCGLHWVVESISRARITLPPVGNSFRRTRRSRSGPCSSLLQLRSYMNSSFPWKDIACQHLAR